MKFANCFLSLFVILVASCLVDSLRVVRILRSSATQNHGYSTYSMQPVYRNRPSRPFPRSFRARSVPFAPSAAAQPAVILLKNDTKAVPFTTVNAALSSAEYESANIDESKVEEGVGPAVSFEFAPSSTLDDNEALDRITAESAENISGPQDAKKNGNKNDLAVEFSDVHPVYVKPPTDFTPVVYPNRRLDGIRSTDKGSAFLPTFLVPQPYPFAYPRGLASWPLGGSRAVQRGSYWESMGSDEALNLAPVYSASASRRRTIFAAPSARRMYKKQSKNSAKPTVAYSSWVIYPSTFRASEPFSQNLPLPLAYQPVSTKRVVSYRPPLSPAARRKTIVKKTSFKKTKTTYPAATETSKTTVNTKTVQQSPVSSHPSAGSGIRTKLPVGLTSWMFGGVRDLTGKHWNMPEQTVNKVQVVPVDRPSNHDNKKDFFDGKELAMSGDVETFVPVSATPVFGGEVDESRPTYTNVYFDDEPSNFNSVGSA